MQTLEIDPTGRLVGTRFTVYHIVPLMLNGYTPEAMTRVYHLSVEQIQAMLRFIDNHRDEVLARHQEIEERIARGNPPWVEEALKLSPWHAKLRARLQHVVDELPPEEANGEGHPLGP